MSKSTISTFELFQMPLYIGRALIHPAYKGELANA